MWSMEESFGQLIKSGKITYNNIQKIETGQGDEHNSLYLFQRKL